MKRRIKYLLPLFLLIVLPNAFGMDDAVLTRITKPYDIREYFLLIPESILKLSREERIKTLKAKSIEELWNLYKGTHILEVLDVSNGYMRFNSASDGGGAIYELTYFIKSDKSRLIALNTIHWSMCCEDSDLRFFMIEKDEWRDVTKTVLPTLGLADFDADAARELKPLEEFLPVFLFSPPRKGKDIRVSLSATFEEMLMEKLGEKYDSLRSRVPWNVSLVLKGRNGRFVIGERLEGE